MLNCAKSREVVSGTHGKLSDQNQIAVRKTASTPIKITGLHGEESVSTTTIASTIAIPIPEIIANTIRCMVLSWKIETSTICTVHFMFRHVNVFGL